MFYKDSRDFFRNKYDTGVFTQPAVGFARTNIYVQEARGDLGYSSGGIYLRIM